MFALFAAMNPTMSDGLNVFTRHADIIRRPPTQSLVPNCSWNNNAAKRLAHSGSVASMTLASELGTRPSAVISM